MKKATIVILFLCVLSVGASAKRSYRVVSTSTTQAAIQALLDAGGDVTLPLGDHEFPLQEGGYVFALRASNTSIRIPAGCTIRMAPNQLIGTNHGNMFAATQTLENVRIYGRGVIDGNLAKQQSNDWTSGHRSGLQIFFYPHKNVSIEGITIQGIVDDAILIGGKFPNGYATDIVVNDVTVRDCGEGILGVVCDGFRVNSCTVDGMFRQDGIETSTVRNFWITDNQVSNIFAGAGLDIYIDSDDGEISGNACHNCPTGATLGHPTGYARRLLFTGNRITGTRLANAVHAHQTEDVVAALNLVDKPIEGNIIKHENQVMQ